MVLRMAKLSVGSVLKEGEPFIYLAPLRSPVEAEVHILPRDVGFIRDGDPVKVKLDAFNFIEHGTAEGTVQWISEGAFTTDDDDRPTREPYYKVRVRVDQGRFAQRPGGLSPDSGHDAAGRCAYWHPLGVDVRRRGRGAGHERGDA